MNGSNVWGSLVPYGDVLPMFKWNIYKTKSIFLSKLSYLIDDSLQITLVQKIFWNLFDFITCTAIVLNFMEGWKLVIFLINIPFEQGEDVTKRH